MEASTSDTSDRGIDHLHLFNIAAELQHAILEQVPPSEIASFRLVSKAAAKLGMHHIPIGINFSFRSHSIERLEKIVNHPVLSTTLKHIRFCAVFAHQFSLPLDRSNVAEWKRHARGMMVSRPVSGSPHMSLSLQQAWWNQFKKRIARIQNFRQSENLDSIFVPAAFYQHSIALDQAKLVENARETFERLGSCFSKLPMLEQFDINTDISLECDRKVLYSFAKLGSDPQHWITLDKAPKVDMNMLLGLLHALLKGQRLMSTTSRLKSLMIPMPERVAHRLLDFSIHVPILEHIKTITFLPIARKSIQETEAMDGSFATPTDPDGLYPRNHSAERTWIAFPSILEYCVGLQVLNVNLCGWQMTTGAMDRIVPMAAQLRSLSVSQALLVSLSISNMHYNLGQLCKALKEYGPSLRSLTLESITLNSYPDSKGWIYVFYFIAEELHLRDLLLKGTILSQDNRGGQKDLYLKYGFPISSCGEDDHTFVINGYITTRHLVQLLVCDSESHSSEAKAKFKLLDAYKLLDLEEAYETVYEDDEEEYRDIEDDSDAEEARREAINEAVYDRE